MVKLTPQTGGFFDNHVISAVSIDVVKLTPQTGGFFDTGEVNFNWILDQVKLTPQTGGFFDILSKLIVLIIIMSNSPLKLEASLTPQYIKRSRH